MVNIRHKTGKEGCMRRYRTKNHTVDLQDTSRWRRYYAQQESSRYRRQWEERIRRKRRRQLEKSLKKAWDVFTMVILIAICFAIPAWIFYDAFFTLP